MTQQRSGQQSPLKTDRGNTVIQDSVVAQVAGIAAQEVENVQMGGGTAAAVGGFLSGVTSSVTGSSGAAPGGSSPARGVTVEVGEEEAAVDLSLAVEYGVSIPQLAEAVRRNVINRVENLTGLRVNEVNIDVADVQFREERPMLERQQQVASEAREQENRA